jgi:hypothetical protein
LSSCVSVLALACVGFAVLTLCTDRFADDGGAWAPCRARTTARLTLFLSNQIVIYGYLLFPDTPESTTAWYFTPEERALCVARLPPNVKQQVTWASLKQTIRRAVVGWRFWMFSLLFTVSAMMEAFGIFSVGPSPCFWLALGDLLTVLVTRLRLCLSG